MIHEHMAQTGRKAHRSHRGKILGAHSHAKANDAESHHDQTHFDHIARIPVSNALIHNLRHHQGHKQLEGCFQQLEYRAKNALFFIALQVLQKRLHTITSMGQIIAFFFLVCKHGREKTEFRIAMTCEIRRKAPHPFVGVDALIDPNQNIPAHLRDDVGIVPYEFY